MRGEVRVALRTDDPLTRFAPGATLLTDRNNPGRLTVKRARMSGKHFVVSFAEVPDRNVAETLSGVKLLIDTESIVPSGSVAGAGTVAAGVGNAGQEPPHREDSEAGDEDWSGDEFEDEEFDEETGEDGFYRHELVGLAAVSVDGETLGTVSDLLLGAAQDLLEVTTAAGEKILVPFVYEIVPEVDLEEQRVVMDPPGGLFPGGTADSGAKS